jgi:hypothetical protein
MKIIVVALIATGAFAAPAQRSVEQLPRCRTSNVSVPKEWKTIAPAGSDVRFRVPADMKPLDDPKVFCVHGCEQWARGTFKVSVSHGMWGPSSFDDDAWAIACVEKRGALRIVQMRSQNDTSTQSTEDIILNIQWSDFAGEADAANVIASLR